MSCQSNLPPIKRMPSGGKSSMIFEMELRVNRMVKLIEEDADSFAKKAEMYYEKRPEMITLVEEFHRMYRTLAERYEKNNAFPPLDFQSQSSGVSEAGSEPSSTMPSPDHRLSRSSTMPSPDFNLGRSSIMPSPDMRLTRRRSAPRAPGFDFFLGSGNASDFRDGYESSTLDYESGSDDFSVKNYYNNEDSLYESEAEVVDPVNKFHPNDEEVAGLRQEIRDKEAYVKKLEEDLKSCQEEVSHWKKQHGKERQEVATLQERVSLYKTTLQERDQELKGLKAAISKADVILSNENERLKEEARKTSNEKMFLEDHIKELEVRCQNLDYETRQAKARRIESERLIAEAACKDKCMTELTKNFIMLQLVHDMLMNENDHLNTEVSSRDDVIDRMNDHVRQLHVELIAAREMARKSGEELMARVRELEREVEKKQRIIGEGVEEKREAIKHLCVSLEHYRNGYLRLRQAMIGNKILPDMASPAPAS